MVPVSQISLKYCNFVGLVFQSMCFGILLVSPIRASATRSVMESTAQLRERGGSVKRHFLMLSCISRVRHARATRSKNRAVEQIRKIANNGIDRMRLYRGYTGNGVARIVRVRGE